jgi:hypothetical protein
LKASALRGVFANELGEMVAVVEADTGLTLDDADVS